MATVVGKNVPVLHSHSAEYFIGSVIGEGRNKIILINLYIPPHTSNFAPTNGNAYKEQLGKV